MILFWTYIRICITQDGKQYQSCNEVNFYSEVDSFNKFLCEKWDEFENITKDNFFNEVISPDGTLKDKQKNIEKILPEYDETFVSQFLEKSVESFLCKYTKRNDECSLLLKNITQDFEQYFNRLRNKTFRYIEVINITDKIEFGLIYAIEVNIR